MMKYNIMMCICWFMALVGCKSTTTEFGITLLNYPEEGNVYLEFDTIRYELTLDSTGKCVILLDQYGSGYGVVKCGYTQIPVYIYEGGVLKLSFDMKGFRNVLISWMSRLLYSGKIVIWKNVIVFWIRYIWMLVLCE